MNKGRWIQRAFEQAEQRYAQKQPGLAVLLESFATICCDGGGGGVHGRGSTSSPGWIEAEKPAFIALLRAFIQAKSPNPPGGPTIIRGER
jgi:hypothetical protein